MCYVAEKSAGTAFPRVPAQLHHCLLTNLGSTRPMNKERNCDERHKWKFEKFGTLYYK